MPRANPHLKLILIRKFSLLTLFDRSFTRLAHCVHFKLIDLRKVYSWPWFVLRCSMNLGVKQRRWIPNPVFLSTIDAKHFEQCSLKLTLTCDAYRQVVPTLSFRPGPFEIFVGRQKLSATKVHFVPNASAPPPVVPGALSFGVIALLVGTRLHVVSWVPRVVMPLKQEVAQIELGRRSTRVVTWRYESFSVDGLPR